MSIDELTIGEAKKLSLLFAPMSNNTSHSMKVGTSYLIRTVTYFYTGRLVSVTDSDIVLEEAAWIADTGRFSDALKLGSLSEIEPYPNAVIVSRASIVDLSEWTHRLPREQK